METRAVQLRVAGQSYKVVSSANEEDLQRLADAVSEKVAEVGARGRTPAPQALLLAAIALAHELEEERARRASVERKTRDMLRRVLVRLDDALDANDDADA
jgi:cell division protein ZapA